MNGQYVVAVDVVAADVAGKSLDDVVVVSVVGDIPRCLVDAFVENIGVVVAGHTLHSYLEKE